MIIGDTPPALGLAHFTAIGVPPLELVGLAARIGYAAVGLRLHLAFPGAPVYEIPAGGDLMRELKRRLDGEGSASSISSSSSSTAASSPLASRRSWSRRERSGHVG